VLDDSLARAKNDPAVTAYYRNAFLDAITFQIFGSAEEGALEQAIYDGAKSGTLKGADDLDALTRKTFGAYSSWPARDPVMQTAWMRKSLMFEDPVYLVNYLYAGLLATKWFVLLERDPQKFASQYVAFLRGGFDGAPVALLQRAFGFDFGCDGTLEEDLALVREKTAELRAAYARTSALLRSDPLR
jgi:oligoendopeptidase F